MQVNLLLATSCCGIHRPRKVNDSRDDSNSMAGKQQVQAPLRMMDNKSSENNSLLSVLHCQLQRQNGLVVIACRCRVLTKASLSRNARWPVYHTASLYKRLRLKVETAWCHCQLLEHRHPRQRVCMRRGQSTACDWFISLYWLRCR